MNGTKPTKPTPVKPSTSPLPSLIAAIQFRSQGSSAGAQAGCAIFERALKIESIE